MIDSNKPSKAHWERNLRQYAHHAKPFFEVFTSKESLHWVLLVRHIDARGWELHLRDPESGGNQSKYLSHGGNFVQASQAGELKLVKAMVKRTQADMEARDGSDRTPLHWAALEGHLPVKQYLCEDGADKEARGERDWTPLHYATTYRHIPVKQYFEG